MGGVRQYVSQSFKTPRLNRFPEMLNPASGSINRLRQKSQDFEGQILHFQTNGGRGGRQSPSALDARVGFCVSIFFC